MPLCITWGLALIVSKDKKISSKSLLIFIHHSSGYIPKIVEKYIQELAIYVDDVILSTNYNGFYDLPYSLFSTKNEGYDFGYFYKALQSVRNEKYDRIIFANDSNILVSTFEKVFKWSRTCQFGVWGLTDSVEHQSEVHVHKRYHVQSHFLVFEKKAIPFLYNFFEAIRFEKNFLSKEGASPELRKRVIIKCEYGLTQYMKESNIKAGAMWSVKNWKPMKDKDINMHFWKWEELIKSGYPLMKKKIYDGTWDKSNNGPEGWPQLPNYGNRWKYIKNE